MGGGLNIYSFLIEVALDNLEKGQFGSTYLTELRMLRSGGFMGKEGKVTTGGCSE